MSIYKDKVAIVTGAGSGIGRALGQELARRGATVVLSDVNAERVDAVAGSITSSGNKAKAITLDVSDFEAVKKMVEDTVREHGTLDYIFNNAGIAVGGEARDVSIDDWRNVFGVNLYGVVNGVMATYPIMVKQGFGHIVNMGSIEGLVPFPATSSYVATKYAVVGLSNALRIEGADLGVKVSVACPGYVKTAIWHDSKLVNIDREKVLDGLPERGGVTSEECASLILRGVERNKAIIAITAFTKIMWILHRISPNLVIWMIRKTFNRARENVRLTD